MGKFCYWDVRNYPDSIIVLTYLAMTFGILTLTIYRLWRVKKHGEHAKRIGRIYFLIMAWALTFGFQELLDTSIYLTVIQGNCSYDMDSYSRIYVRIDAVPAFLIQTIFLSICKIFFKGLTGSIPISLMAKW
jgi:predicted metallopeptidase